MSILEVMDTDGRAVALYADTCSDGGLRQKQWQAHLAKHDEARIAVAELLEACQFALEALEAIIKHDSGIKEHLKKAIAKATKP